MASPDPFLSPMNRPSVGNRMLKKGIQAAYRAKIVQAAFGALKVKAIDKAIRKVKRGR